MGTPTQRLHPDLSPDTYLGRLAVLDRQERMFAYELRHHDTHAARGAGQSGATADLILRAVAELGLEHVVGDEAMLLACPREVLHSELLDLLPPRRVILKLGPKTARDAAMTDQLHNIRKRGFRLALKIDPTLPDPGTLLDLLSVIEVDCSLFAHEDAAGIAELFRSPSLKLMATQVHDRIALKQLQALGFNLFQGGFMCMPHIVAGRRPANNKWMLLQLMVKLHDPETSVAEVEKLVRQDAGLSTRLLRYLNSKAFSVSREITSVQQAVVLLGLDRLRQWLPMLVMSMVQDKPTAVMTTALIRGAMCQQLATRAGTDVRSAFSIGLFSVLDALLDMPMEDLLKELSLTANTRGALTSHAGPEGAMLACAKAYELGQWERATVPGLTTLDVSNAWLTAVKWTDVTLASLEGRA